MWHVTSVDILIDFLCWACDEGGGGGGHCPMTLAMSHVHVPGGMMSEVSEFDTCQSVIGQCVCDV